MLKFLKIIVPAGVGTASMLTMAYVVADQFVVDIPAPIRGTLIQPAYADEVAPTVSEQMDQVAQLVAPEGGFGLGRPALAEEVAAWDIDVRPDGTGLPVGSGDVWTGEEVFVEKCAACHGDFGEAVGRWPVLAGGQNTLTRDDPVKTIGSYWPYLSTVFDYVNRAMPFGEAQSLSADEVYAVTAYLLYVNDLADEDFELSHENFLDVRMPNEDNFYMDDRPETELVMFSAEPCMRECKDSVEITMRASILDVTPGDSTDDAPQDEAAAEPVEESDVQATETELAVEDSDIVDGGVDPDLIAAGEGVFRQCRSCHMVGENPRNGTGPHLNGVLGRTIGGIDGFRYSNTFKDAAEAGEVWTPESLAAFFANPRDARPGTKMAFRGLRSDDEIAAIIAYLQSLEAQ